MKKLLLLLLLAPVAFCQVTNPGIFYVPVAPSGSCNNVPPVQVLNSNGAVYTCANGTWTAQTSGGGASPTGPAGGSLSGTYPNPSLTTAGVQSAISGQSIAPSTVVSSTDNFISSSPIAATHGPNITATVSSYASYGAGTTNLNAVAVNGYVACGVAGGGSGPNCVALYGNAFATVNNAKVWGENPSALAATGITGAKLIGSEVDVNANDTSDSITGVDAVLGGTATNGSATAFVANGTANPWSIGYNITAGAVSTYAMLVPTPLSPTGGAQNTLPLEFVSNGPSGSNVLGALTLDSTGTFQFSKPINVSGQISSNSTIQTSGAFNSFTYQLAPSGTATNAINYGSGAFSFISSVWNGTAAIHDNYLFQASPAGTGSNPNSTLILSASGSTGTHTLSLNSINLAVPNLSTAGVVTNTSAGLLGTQALAGAGAAVVTGPATSTNGDVVIYTGSAGQTQDSGTQLNSLAPLASPALTGNPTAPTQTAGDNSTKIATTAYVATAVTAGATPAWSAITSGANSQTGSFSTAGPWTYSAAGAASTPGVTISGAPYTGGTGTTNLPQLYLNSGATGPTNLSTGGTIFGANAPSGWAGNFLDLRTNGGSSLLSINQNGAITTNSSIIAANRIQSSAQIQGTYFVQGISTITASATPAIVATNGLQTITLSANATPTISGIAAGQRISFQICQPASGGPYTWTWPAAIHGGMTIGTTASTCSMQSFNSYTGTTLVPESTGVINIAP